MAGDDILYEDGQHVSGICLIFRFHIINGHQKVKLFLKCTTLNPNISFKGVCILYLKSSLLPNSESWFPVMLTIVNSFVTLDVLLISLWGSSFSSLEIQVLGSNP